MKQAIRTECQLTGFSSRADGSLGFRGVTPELSTEEKVALMNLQGLLVEILVQPKEDQYSEVLTVHREMDGKSPSQRLRGVLYLLYKQEQKRLDTTWHSYTFQVFYDRHIEKFIDHVKLKLDSK